jgi:hypothetical protein
MHKEPPVETDLTDEGPKRITKVPLTKSLQVHFCQPCSDIYFQHKSEMTTMAAETLQEFRAKQDELKRQLWEKFKNGSSQESQGQQSPGASAEP